MSLPESIRFSSRIARHGFPFLLGLILLGTATVTSATAETEVPSPAPRQAAGSQDWPRFLGPDGNGKSSAGPLPTPWPDSGLPLLWQKTLGEGYSMPSVAMGRLFLFDRHGDKVRLSCLDSQSGKELWRSEYSTQYEDSYGFSGGPRANPVIDGDRVYTFGAKGRLRAHQTRDGKLLWDVDTESTYGVLQNFFGVGSTPIIEGNLLIVMVGGSPPNSPKLSSGKVRSNGSALVAFDKFSGEERYRSGEDLASYSSPVITSHAGRRWGLAFLRGGLTGFEPKTGKQDFHIPWRARRMESVNAATPVVVGNKVFITESYELGAALIEFGPAGARIVWKDKSRREQSLASHWSTPIHHKGYLYGSHGSGSGDAELRCIEMATGKVMWAEAGLNRSTLLFVDGHLVVLTEYGRLLLVAADPETFRLVSETEVVDSKGQPLLEHPAWNPPILANGILYARGKHRLVALRLLP